MQGRAHRFCRRPLRPALAATPAHLGGGQAHGRPRTAHRGGPGAAWPRHAVGHDRPAGAVLRRALEGYRALSSHGDAALAAWGRGGAGTGEGRWLWNALAGL